MKEMAARSMRVMGKGAFGVWEKAVALEEAGHNIIHVELGEPDFSTPAHIIAAAEASMRAGRTHYGVSKGESSLRKAAADYLARTRDIEADWQRVLITPGVKGSLYFSMQVLIEDGDEVLVPDPGYPPYKELVRLAGGVPIDYPVPLMRGEQINSAELAARITDRTKMIILNTPANPTGTILSAETLAAIAKIVLEHDLWVLSDEVYHQIYFGDTPPPSIYSIPGMAERTVLMDGFSKSYAMTGWRVGFGLFPEPLITPISNMMVMDHSCLPPFIQDACTAALNGPQELVAEMREAYRRRRDAAIDILNTIPEVDYIYPDGAFYILMDVSRTGMDSETLAYKLLDNGVAMLPQGDRWLRIAFTQSEADITTAIRRLAETIRG